jgi:ubiquinone/menaquinone biosynthesis C-methylase UbiE
VFVHVIVSRMSQDTASTGDLSLVPPVEKLFDGTASAQQFIEFGEGFVHHVLVPRARLTSSDVFLDVGCGNGSVARALTKLLSLPGRYEGLDVSADSIEWLQEHYQPYAGFRFSHADVYNKMYHSGGSVTAGDYRLPYADRTFSMALLKSVFTHMLPGDVRNYLRELGRVVAPGGRAAITFFLLNDESRAFVTAEKDIVKMRTTWHDDPLCRVANPELPEEATAHDEGRIRAYVAEAGFTVSEVVFGDWCGRPSLLGLQDLMILIRL